MGFDLVDLVILAATLIGIANGYRRGFWLSAAQYSGLVGGVLLGAAAATPVLELPRDPQSRRAPSGRGAGAGDRRQPRLEHRVRRGRADPPAHPARRRPYRHRLSRRRGPVHRCGADDVLVPRAELFARAEPGDRTADPAVVGAPHTGQHRSTPTGLPRQRRRDSFGCQFLAGLRRPRAGLPARAACRYPLLSTRSRSSAPPSRWSRSRASAVEGW